MEYEIEKHCSDTILFFALFSSACNGHRTDLFFQLRILELNQISLTYFVFSFGTFYERFLMCVYF